MGFSVSATFSVIVVASLVSLVQVYTVSDNTMSDVLDSYYSNFDDLNLKKNDDINITGTSIVGNAASYNLTLTVKNEGSTTLKVSDWSLIIDGGLTDFNTSDTYVLPLNEITITVYDLSGGGAHRAKLVTERGQSRFASYTVV
jgi:archaellum component FlaF (FlaF/FlaG flagellin family)